MLSKAIELVGMEIRRLENLAKSLYDDGLYQREAYRTCEVKRFKRILDLLTTEEAKL